MKRINKKIFVLLGLLIALVAFIILSPMLRTSQTARPLSSVGCGAPYHVDGKRILDAHGNTFVPYGVQLDGILFAQTNWRTDGALTYLTHDQLLAAHDFWHSNTVSLQIGSKALFAQAPYDAAYLAALDQTVAWATQLGMNTLLVLQYEGYGNSAQVLPTQDTSAAWRVLASHYKNNAAVFFDLFNEPNPTALSGGDDTESIWSLWQHGGTLAGNVYVGLQQLVDTVRGSGAANLVFVDGLATGEDIALLPAHLITGKNVVYAIHPYLSAQHRTESDWDTWFGNAATGNFPVVADEWSEYQSDANECFSDAPTIVPRFLAYLRRHEIGLLAYALFPGLLIRGWDFRNPTAFDEPTYTCRATPLANFDSRAQGSGQLLKAYFVGNSVQASTCPKG